MTDVRPLVVHFVHRFDTGGIENGIVNLVNHMPEAAYRHAVVAITDVAPAFAGRIRRRDVLFESLHKPPGQGMWLYPQLLSLLRRWRPAVAHTRNLGTLEFQIPAWAARVPARLHGEHGWDVGDLGGTNRRYQLVRRAYRPFVQHYMALSRESAAYLQRRVGVPAERITQVCNGVDAERFTPAAGGRARIGGCPFGDAGEWIIGTVGRMQPVKDQTLLARAFVHAIELAPTLRNRLRLILVGDGPLRAQAQAILANAGMASLAWLPGERSDVADVMRGFDCFALPSIAEGISNTILEAMASGLPVVATAVGGNAELVADGQSGQIVPASDFQAMAASLLRLAEDPTRARAMGSAGRRLAEERFSLQAMVAAYQGIYDKLLGRPGDQRKGV
jgi:sugar transferase (PEP-CTERM/EpsH1 system associated)